MKSLVTSLTFAGLLLSTAPLAAHDYRSIGSLSYAPVQLEPWSKQIFDPHCDDVSRRMCGTVHYADPETHREKLLRSYCETQQYDRCRWARSLQSR